MRDAVEEDSKEKRIGFTTAVNATMEDAVLKIRAKSELERRRDIKEAARVFEDDNRRRRAQEED